MSCLKVFVSFILNIFLHGLSTITHKDLNLLSVSKLWSVVHNDLSLGQDTQIKDAIITQILWFAPVHLLTALKDAIDERRKKDSIKSQVHLTHTIDIVTYLDSSQSP